MPFNYNNIKKIEWEISTHCNARCPQCPRNDYGGATVPSLPLINVSLETAKTILPIEFIQQLEEVYFCGTYGDPCMNKDFTRICQWLKEVNPKLVLAAHTNGSLQNKTFWKEAAKYVDGIGFGIDGLEDTNHLYRVDTNWQKIIANVKTYVDNGGTAIWDFIIFRHNEHQVDEARQLSSTLGFKEFRVKYTARFFNKKHEFIMQWPVKNRKGLIERYLELPTNVNYQNMIYVDQKKVVEEHGSIKQYLSNTNVECYSQKTNHLYISADGYVFPCGWLQDRMYGIEAESHPDKQLLNDMWNSIGGSQYANINFTKIEDIVNGKWFNILDNSFNGPTRLERCGAICGQGLNFIGFQNIDVNQKNPTKKLLKLEK